MVDKWVGKIAVVTGASSGIGAAIFKDLAKAGIEAVGLARRVERIEEIVKQQTRCHAYYCDVTNSESVKEAFKWIENRFGFINILINNAGVSKNTRILENSEESMEKLNEVIDTNLRGVVECTREAFKLMKKSNDFCLIVNINSITGHKNIFFKVPLNVYPASKHAVTALTETLRQELILMGDNKIRVTSLSPGRVRTDIEIAGGFEDESQEDDSKLKPEDVSGIVLFLMSTDYSVNISEIIVQAVGEKF